MYLYWYLCMFTGINRYTDIPRLLWDVQKYPKVYESWHRYIHSHKTSHKRICWCTPRMHAEPRETEDEQVPVREVLQGDVIGLRKGTVRKRELTSSLQFKTDTVYPLSPSVKVLRFLIVPWNVCRIHHQLLREQCQIRPAVLLH